MEATMTARDYSDTSTIIMNLCAFAYLGIVHSRFNTLLTRAYYVYHSTGGMGFIRARLNFRNTLLKSIRRTECVISAAQLEIYAEKVIRNYLRVDKNLRQRYIYSMA